MTDDDHATMMAHTKRATELFRQCKAIHDAEMAGSMSIDDALGMVIALLHEAKEESDKARVLMLRFRDD